MRKKVVAIILLTTAIFIGGCSKQNQKISSEFFPKENTYHIGFKSDLLQTRARIFFDESGLFHLLHEDPSSPLFGLEEIYTEKGVTSHFYDLEFESLPYPGGVATIHRVIDTISHNEPTKVEKNEKKVTYCYYTESLNFDFVFTGTDSIPIQICGTDGQATFEINFSTDA